MDANVQVDEQVDAAEMPPCPTCGQPITDITYRPPRFRPSHSIGGHEPRSIQLGAGRIVTVPCDHDVVLADSSSSLVCLLPL